MIMTIQSMGYFADLIVNRWFDLSVIVILILFLKYFSIDYDCRSWDLELINDGEALTVQLMGFIYIYIFYVAPGRSSLNLVVICLA